ncbi:hypothetical protein NDU88_005525 [Pleurodeles waltl]|uniref:Uncharacterized protein n=1 Tax=Pleurodeles waltl TaxID=8319 RepID=A0AAV7SM47_PLEWA|nr:hypothetical protein NDU88_005525 [Pleurodeles waltl]
MRDALFRPAGLMKGRERDRQDNRPKRRRPDRSALRFLLLCSVARRPGDLTEGRGFASKRGSQLSSGPRETRSGHPHRRPKASPDASTPHELPTILQGGCTEPNRLPTRSGARRRVECPS